MAFRSCPPRPGVDWSAEFKAEGVPELCKDLCTGEGDDPRFGEACFFRKAPVAADDPPAPLSKDPDILSLSSLISAAGDGEEPLCPRYLPPCP